MSALVSETCRACKGVGQLYSVDALTLRRLTCHWCVGTGRSVRAHSSPESAVGAPTSEDIRIARLEEAVSAKQSESDYLTKATEKLIADLAAERARREEVERKPERAECALGRERIRRLELERNEALAQVAALREVAGDALAELRYYERNGSGEHASAVKVVADELDRALSFAESAARAYEERIRREAESKGFLAAHAKLNEEIAACVEAAREEEREAAIGCIKAAAGPLGPLTRHEEEAIERIRARGRKEGR